MYLSLLDLMLQQTLEGNRYPAGREIEGYLALLEARALVNGCEGMESGRRYLKHGNDKGDHYMLDGSGVLTGIIDWEW